MSLEVVTVLLLMVKDRIWILVSRKLSGEATASELRELSTLIETQANADLYLQAMDEFWSLPAENDQEFLEATYHLHLNRLKNKGFDLEAGTPPRDEAGTFLADEENFPSRANQKKLLTTAIVFLLGLLSFLAYKYQVSNAAPPAIDKPAISEISTKPGSRTKIRLPDGSSVWLNGGSKLVYDNRKFGNTIREVTLTGEGYFDIVKNKECPFILHANRIDIKVTGTSFNVRAYPGEMNTEASLVRGSIEVSMKDKAEKIIMKPNDKLIARNDDKQDTTSGASLQSDPATKGAKDNSISMDHLTIAPDEQTIVETAWVDNKLVFDKESFEEVAIKMERWYGVSIRFGDEQLKTQRLTGSFEKETVSEALNALQLSTPFFKYKINNQYITIFK